MPRSLLSKLAIAVIILLTVGFSAFLALPQIVNTLLLDSFLQRLPFSDSRAAFSKITISSTSGSIELEHHDQPFVSIPQFTLNYSPAPLLGGRAETLTVEHGVFHFYRTGGIWAVPGIPDAPSGSESESTELPTSLPVVIDAVVLNDCRIVLHEPGEKDIAIGVSGKIKFSYNVLRQANHLVSISGSVAFSDDITAAVDLSVIFDQHQIKAQFGINDALMPDIVRFLPTPLKGFAFGALDADLEMVAGDRSFDTLHYHLNGNLQDVAYAHDRAVLSGAASAEEVTFVLSGNRSELRYDISAAAVDAPLQAELAFSGEARLGVQELHASGTLDTLLSFAGQADSAPLTAVLNYSAAWSESTGLMLETEGRLRPQNSFTIPEALIGNSMNIELDELRITSLLHLQNEQLQSRVSFDSSPFLLAYRDGIVQGNGVRVNAAMNNRHGQMSVRIDGSAGKLTLPQRKLAVDGLQFSLPIAPGAASSSASDEQNGTLAINAIAIHGKPVASLSTDIRRTGTNYFADGTFKSPAVPDGRLHFTATASALPVSAALSWQLAPVTVSSSALARYGNAPPDLFFEALVAANGEIELSGNRLSGWMTTSIDDGTLQSPDKKVFMEDIDCTIELPELPRLLSSPGQRCTVGSLDISTLHFDDALVIFRLEDPPALFIEKSALSWCDGTLDSGSLRLAMDNPEIDTVFYGSRINLGQLLEQFGFKISEGEGSLNGKLPVRISRETVEFDGGFLFSTPGTGGIVRFTDTDLLRQGIGGVSEAGSVGYALQALEDFSYNWTKLTFDTINDELLLTLELDGKPRTALPFTLNKNGMIVESDKGAGLQYPIRLDVNVRLPLAELFRVGRSFNSIMENSQ